jgi:putative transposase
VTEKIPELRGIPIAIGGIEDHVHLLCSFDPTISIAYLVQQVKGSSSHLMTHEITGRESFKWQGAYGAFTVGRDSLEPVRDYILNQREHHAEQRLWPEWERTWLPDVAPALDEASSGVREGGLGTM